MPEKIKSANIKRKRTAKQRRILEMGAKIFAQRGYHATRMQDIADELDLQKGSLYYYFPSKEALLFSIIEEELGNALAEMDQVLNTIDPPLIKIEQAVIAHLTTFHRYADIYSIYMFEKLNLINQEAAEQVDTLGRSIEQNWHKLLQEGIDSGDLKPSIDIAMATKAILGMCNMTLIWFNTDGKLSIEETAKLFVSYMFDGLKLS